MADHTRCNELITPSQTTQEPGLEATARYGLAQQKTLHFVAVQLAKYTCLLVGFDPFRHYLELQRMSQVDDRGNQRNSFRPGVHVRHERAIDLQRIRRQLGKVAE